MEEKYKGFWKWYFKGLVLVFSFKWVKSLPALLILVFLIVIGMGVGIGTAVNELSLYYLFLIPIPVTLYVYGMYLLINAARGSK